MFQEPYKTVMLTDEVTGLEFSLEYFILEEQTVVSDTIRTITYSVAVQMRRQGKCELAKADGICTTRTEAEEFVELIARHGVTPTTFSDVVDDSFSLPVRREVRETVKV